MRILFWNLQKKDAPSELSAFCQAQEVDIIVIAEAGPYAGALGESLSAPGVGGYLRISPTTKRFEVFSRLRFSQVRAKHDSSRFSIWQIKPVLSDDVIFMAVHLPSKINAEDLDQHTNARLCVTELQHVERELGHRRSIVLGDFNMHPFDDGMVAADAFHAVMDRQIASKLYRTVNGQQYYYFYNPMWSRMGDQSKGPPGTHSYRESGVKAFFWHTFDQILLRPELLGRVPEKNIQVLTSFGELSLLNKKGKIFKPSDHLPILVELSSPLS